MDAFEWALVIGILASMVGAVYALITIWLEAINPDTNPEEKDDGNADDLGSHHD